MNTHVFLFTHHWLVLLACFLPGPHLAMAHGTGIWRELWSNLSTTDTSIGGLTNVANNPNWPNNPTADYTKVFSTYSCALTSALGTLTSASAALTVNADTIPPTLLSAVNVESITVRVSGFTASS